MTIANLILGQGLDVEATFEQCKAQEHELIEFNTCHAYTFKDHSYIMAEYTDLKLVLSAGTLDTPLMKALNGLLLGDTND